MKKLQKLDFDQFKATSLNKDQNKTVVGGTHITTGETGGTDSNQATRTFFPLRGDSDLRNDPIINGTN